MKMGIGREVSIFDYIDSRAEVTAKADTGPDAAKIIASLELSRYLTRRILSLIGKQDGLTVATAVMVKKI